MLQVEQAIINYKFEKDNILYWFIKVDNSSWIDRVIENGLIKKFIISDTWIFIDLLRREEKIIKFISNLKKVRHDFEVNKLFISQYSSDYSLLAIKHLNAQEIILMDEGTASFGVCAVRKRVQYLDVYKLKIKSIFYNVKLSFPKKITYFTQYDLDVMDYDSIKKYTFKKIPNKINLIEGNIGLLGSSIVEVGLVSLDYYMNIIKQFKLLYKEKEIYYYSHRKEDNIKLGKISELGIVIVCNDLPFEIFYRNTKSCPHILFSFFSPILLNLKAQFEKTPKSVIIQFDLNELKFNKKIITDIYDSYKKNKGLEFLVL
ncbi:hypothetical protein [Polaribacter sp.]|uniref:hypothetical protein n=1 Tax=Polaribacter sp. TaxID=1920175 RepID=UPI0040470F3F